MGHRTHGWRTVRNTISKSGSDKLQKNKEMFVLFCFCSSNDTLKQQK